MDNLSLPLIGSGKKHASYMLGKRDAQTAGSGCLPRNRRPTRSPDVANLGLLLTRRTNLLKRRIRIVDLEFSLAIIGVLIIVIDAELIFSHVYEDNSLPSNSLKVMTSVTTLGLLMTICAYYVTTVRIRMVTHSINHWYYAMSSKTMVSLILELLICLVHPIPGNVSFPIINIPGVGTFMAVGPGNQRPIPINAMFSVLMIFRLYLAARFCVMHSRYVLDASTQSLGALNRVSINTQFVMKALMKTSPGTVLISFMIGVFLITSWCMRICESYSAPDSDEDAYLQVMWLVAVTFLTLGYGDLTPHSYCGRFIAVSAALMGVGSMALSVAVLGRQLEQTRPEKYVHVFVQKIRIDKQRKHAAANVVKRSFILWNAKQKAIRQDRDMNITRHRCRLIHAIRQMKDLKSLSAQISEGNIGLVEVFKVINDVFDTVTTMRSDQKAIHLRLDEIENLMTDMRHQLTQIQEKLTMPR